MYVNNLTAVFKEDIGNELITMKTVNKRMLSISHVLSITLFVVIEV